MIAGHAVWRPEDSRVGVAFVGRGQRRRRREILRLATGVDRRVAWLRQVHGSASRVARAGCSGDGDAVITSRNDLALAISTADCVPVVLGAGDRIAAVHAGWRGVVAGIVESAVTGLAAQAEAPRAWIGPSIGPCCYEVGPEVAARLVNARGVASERVIACHGRNGRPYVDLVKAVELQLRNAGVAVIEAVAPCTRCEPLLCSYRRDGARAERNLTFAWLR